MFLLSSESIFDASQRYEKVLGNRSLREKIKRNKKRYHNMKKNFIKDLFVLWFALAALVCAALNLHISLNMLGQKGDAKGDKGN